MGAGMRVTDGGCNWGKPGAVQGPEGMGMDGRCVRVYGDAFGAAPGNTGMIAGRRGEAGGGMLHRRQQLSPSSAGALHRSHHSAANPPDILDAQLSHTDPAEHP